MFGRVAGIWRNELGTHRCRELDSSKLRQYEISSFWYPLKHTFSLPNINLSYLNYEEWFRLYDPNIEYFHQKFKEILRQNWPSSRSQYDADDSEPHFLTTDQDDRYDYNFVGLDHYDIDENNYPTGSWYFFLQALYLFTAVISIVMNALTIMVLLRGFKCALKRYIINLAMSDLLMSVQSIAFTYIGIIGFWTLPGYLCPIVWVTVFQGIFVAAATITMIGIDRYIAIMYPLVNRRRAPIKVFHLKLSETRLCILIWIVGLFIAAPEYYASIYEPLCHTDNKVDFVCSQVKPKDVWRPYYVVAIYLFNFFLPFLLLSYLYLNIALRLCRHKVPENRCAVEYAIRQRKQLMAAKGSFLVVFLFMFSWLPITTLWLLEQLDLRPDYLSKKMDVTLNLLGKLHSCVNPIIYCFMSDKFRGALISLIHRKHTDKYSKRCNV